MHANGALNVCRYPLLIPSRKQTLHVFRSCFLSIFRKLSLVFFISSIPLPAPPFPPPLFSIQMERGRGKGEVGGGTRWSLLDGPCIDDIPIILLSTCQHHLPLSLCATLIVLCVCVCKRETLILRSRAHTSTLNPLNIAHS